MPDRITVVGGGISGLVTAYRLASDYHVTVLEVRDELGGCLASTTLQGTFPDGVDVGAEASLFRRHETKDLATELGLEFEFPSPAHSSQVLSGGHLHPIPKRTVMGVPGNPEDLFELLGPAATTRLANEVLTPPIAGADTSLGEFLSERLGASIVDALVDPLLGGVYAGSAWNLSLAATVPALLPAAQEGTSVLELVRALLVTRDREANPSPVFMSLVGGINRLIPALEEKILARGGRIFSQSPVQSLHSGVEGWTVNTPGQTFVSEAVVLATPAHVSQDLLAEFSPRSSALLGHIPYASTALVVAAIDVSTRELAGSGFLAPTTEDTFIKASTYVSNKWPWVHKRLPESTALIRMSIGRFGDAAGTWQDFNDEDLIDTAFADWSAITGRDDRLISAEVHRWEAALPQYLPGHSELVEEIDHEMGEIPGLHLAGSAYFGVGIPACIQRGLAVADRISDDRIAHHEIAHHDQDKKKEQ